MSQLERASLPDTVLAATPSAERAALAHTRRVAKSHEENFPVLSALLPARLRQDFANVYAYCRGADDLADEPRPGADRRAALRAWRDALHACFAGRAAHPVFVALRSTIERHALPIEPFARLLDAFEQDQIVTRYDSWQQLLDYCTGSANPVGQLVLRLCGCRDAGMDQLADATCTALQLVNFWQDVRRDVLERDRLYVPAEVAHRHGLDLARLVIEIQRSESVASHRFAPELIAAHVGTLRELCQRTWPLFLRGRELWPHLARDVRPVIQLFSMGGESTLRAVERGGYLTLAHRPRLTRWRKGSLLLRAWFAKWVAVP